MGHTSYSMAEKRLHERYKLTTPGGVRLLLEDIHKLRSARFFGTDTGYISNILVDFEKLVEMARLSEAQSQSLFTMYEKGFTQEETSELLGISQQGVSKNINNAINRIVLKAKEVRYDV